ncbi:MAG: flagellar hook-length control protein FliK [Gammaproteobacteria bacterium]|nr:flagellar hook-length control protein FliK [Gammaproteobacteria bacterium]
MQPIDLSKISAETNKIESEKTSATNSSKDVSSIKDLNSETINTKLSSAIAEKQRLAIGLLLKQTLQNLTNEGLLSVNTQKALLSAKNILPGEFTQLYIQDRVQQHKLADTLATTQLKPSPLTNGTVNQWFSGQLLQTIVYQGSQNGTASLLVNKEGQFSPSLISQLNLITQNDKSISNEIIKNSQVVQIKTSLEILAGQQLLLQVNKSASNISFELKHPPRESNIVSQYINQLISRQQALPQLIASLKEISTQTNQTNTFFTPAFKSQVDSVLQQFPQLSQLSTGKEVKSALQNSGQFLESKILNSAQNTVTQHTLNHTNITSDTKNLTPPNITNTQISTTDLKAGLSRLVNLIKNNEAILAPQLLTAQSSLYKSIATDGLIKPNVHTTAFFDLPAQTVHAQVQKAVANANLFQLNNHLLIQNRILDQLESVLSRIVVTQFQSRESSDQSLMNFEIPFRHNDQQEILQLKIREEFKEKEADLGNKIWTVNMAFYLQSLGGIRIYITLDKKDLAIQFWTEEKESKALFQKYFYLLNERLTSEGFTISQLAAFHGIPKEAEKEQIKSHFIVDERV